MKKMIGSPGTMSGLMLRLGQCATSSASIGVMVSSFGFSRYTAFCFLVASMGLEMIWSLGLACLDVYAIRLKSDIQSPIFLSLFTVGDWVTALLSLAAACSSAGVTVLFTKDTEFCRPYVRLVMFLVGTLTRDGEDGVVSSNPRRSIPSLRRSDVRNPPEEESPGSLM